MGMLIPAQINFNAPSFEGLLQLLTNFALAWAIKYWWFLAIVGILWYTRWYRFFWLRRSRNAGSRALTATFGHAAGLSSRTIVLLSGFGLAAAEGFLWLLKSVGMLTMGAGAGDPIILGNIAAILVSLAAGLGLDALVGVNLGPIHVAFAFALVLFIGFFWRLASREAEER